MLKLENKNALVTGGSAGIGLGCAKSFAADGANVLIVGRTAERLEKAKGELASGLFATKEIYNDYLECMPISRHGTVEDISQAVRFLCGPESSWITGVVMSVDGGHHLRRGPNLEPIARATFGDDLVEGRILD